MVVSRQPQVTIIISGVKSATEFATCLARIQHSHYHHYDVVAVIDNETSQQEKRAIRQLGVPALTLRLYRPRQRYSETQLLLNAYRRSRRGGTVLLLTTKVLLAPDTLKRTVAQLQLHKSSDGVRYSQSIGSVSTMSELVAVFAVLSRQLLTKSLSILHLYRASRLAVGMYRQTSFLRAVRGQSRTRLTYDNGVVVSEGVKSYERLSWPWVAAAFVLLATMIYSTVLAATLQTAWPLFLSWVIVGLWLMAAIWSDETNRIWHKVGLSLCVPMSYFVIASALMVGGAIRIFRRQTF
jgi:hypothetical protein